MLTAVETTLSKPCQRVKHPFDEWCTALLSMRCAAAISRSMQGCRVTLAHSTQSACSSPVLCQRLAGRQAPAGTSHTAGRSLRQQQRVRFSRCCTHTLQCLGCKHHKQPAQACLRADASSHSTGCEPPQLPGLDTCACCFVCMSSWCCCCCNRT